MLNLPDEFRAVVGLGAATDVFEIKRKNRIGALVGAVIFLGGAGLMVLIGFGYAYRASQRYGPAVFMKRLSPMLVFAFVLALVGAWAAWSAYTNWNRRVVAYARGLAVRDRKGLRFWRWEQIRAVYQAVTKHYTNGIYTGTTHVYTIEVEPQGREVFDDRYQNIEKLGELLRRRTFDILYDRAAQEYNAGKTLQFGRVAIDKNGIAIGKKSFPWDSVAQVSVQRGVLRVMKQGGGWFGGASVPVSRIPNLAVLLSIVDQVKGLNTGG